MFLQSIMLGRYMLLFWGQRDCSHYVTWTVNRTCIIFVTKSYHQFAVALTLFSGILPVKSLNISLVLPPAPRQFQMCWWIDDIISVSCRGKKKEKEKRVQWYLQQRRSRSAFLEGVYGQGFLHESIDDTFHTE